MSSRIVARPVEDAAGLAAWDKLSSEAPLGNLYQCPRWAQPLASYGVKSKIIGLWREDRLVGGGLFRSIPLIYTGMSLTQCLQGPVFSEWHTDWAEPFLSKVIELSHEVNSLSLVIERCPQPQVHRDLSETFANLGHRVVPKPGPSEAVLTLESRSLVDIWRDFSEGTRRAIRKGRDNNIEIRRLERREDLLQAHAAWMATAARKGFSDVRPWPTLEPVLRHCLDERKGLVLGSYHAGRLAAAIFVTLKGDTAAYVYGGFMDGAEKCHPNHILHYEAIRECLQKGLKAYSFGDLISPQSIARCGLDQFKLGFGSSVVQRLETILWVRKPLAFGLVEWLRRRSVGRSVRELLKRRLLRPRWPP